MNQQVFIHIGPPKTGTSAIQKWLLEHRKKLEEHGIYYPDHSIDKNGVSSGNVRELFDGSGKSQLVFSERKKQLLLDRADKKGLDKLVLSSEFFFHRAEPLLEAFPYAKFIAYIRSPLEIVESGYNQGIKRGSQTKLLNARAKALRVGWHNSKHFLNKFSEYIDKYGDERFLIRSYGRGCFTGGNLVADFLSIFSLEDLVSEHSFQKVNRSYSFEAMEFKRWFNQFEDPAFHNYLDIFLQKYSFHSKDFSLISPNEFDEARLHCYEVLKDFCSKHEVSDSEKLLTNILNSEQKNYREQNLPPEDFLEVLSEFLDIGNESRLMLKRFLRNVPEELKKDEIYMPILEKELGSYDSPFSWLRKFLR